MVWLIYGPVVLAGFLLVLGDRFREYLFPSSKWFLVGIILFSVMASAANIIGLSYLFYVAGLMICLAALCATFAVILSRHFWLAPIPIGFWSNGVVILANGGMPVSATALAGTQIAPEQMSNLYFVSADNALLPWLGDWIYFPGGTGIASPGDVLIIFGACVIILNFCFNRKWRERDF